MAVRLLGAMPTFTGYEPKNFLGKGPSQAPPPAPTAETAAQQLVGADSVGHDLSNLMEAELSSLFEDLYNEPLEPTSDTLVSECGPKGLAV